MTSPFIRMHRLFRRLQQKNRFIGPAQLSGLTPAETHFLLELDAESSRSISELGNLLGIDQSFSSRVAQNLVKKKLLRSVPSHNDARRKHLSITPLGRSLIRKIDNLADSRYKRFAASLNPEEEQQLTHLFRQIADGYGHPPGVRRKGELQYRVEQRRITRCFELLGEQVFGSSLSSSSWQLLAELVLSPVAPQPTELADLLSLAQNSLSSILTTMEKQDLILRERRSDDKRSISLKATKSGKVLYQKIEKHAAGRLQHSLSKLPSHELESHLQVLEKFIGEREGILPPLGDQFVVTQVSSQAERAAARGYVARSMVERGEEDFIPDRFLIDEEILILQLENRQIALVGICRSPLSVTIAGWSPEVTPWLLLGFISKAIQISAPQNLEFNSDIIVFAPLIKYLEINASAA